jgi:tetratricopeptide (TPR) repeat protein
MTEMHATRSRTHCTTAGDIAAINLESARQRSWNRFWRAPSNRNRRVIVEQEQLTAQFIGDLAPSIARDARGELARARAGVRADRAHCSAGRVLDASIRGGEREPAQAMARGAPTDATDRLLLTIDQATGTNLSAVLAARRERAARPGHWAERIPLGALLADLGEFDEADRTYVEALRSYPDVSPFAPAWVSFLLGVLWGECVPAPDPERAAQWYRIAIEYLPGYVKARVHLAEIHLDAGRTRDAAALLAPALESGDPEVSWRLADIAHAAGDVREAARLLAALAPASRHFSRSIRSRSPITARSSTPAAAAIRARAVRTRATESRQSRDPAGVRAARACQRCPSRCEASS